MRGVFVAKATKLFDFHAVWVVLLFFHSVVVTLFAVLACKCDFGSHYTPPTFFMLKEHRYPVPRKI